MSSPLRRRIGFGLPILGGLIVLLASQFGPTPRPVGAPAVPAGVDLGVTESPPARVPVLLLPGWGDKGDRLWPLRDALRTAGWDSTQVRVMEFEDPVGSNVAHAEEIAAAVERLRARTGSDRVDIVAHSMGGLATRWYLQHGGTETVRRTAYLASPHRGTWSSFVAWGEGAREMHPESEFLATLRPGLPPGIEGLTIRTEVDTHILPNESSVLPGVADVLICCPSHVLLPAHPEVMDAVIEFLTRHPEDA